MEKQEIVIRDISVPIGSVFTLSAKLFLCQLVFGGVIFSIVVFFGSLLAAVAKVGQ